MLIFLEHRRNRLEILFNYETLKSQATLSFAPCYKDRNPRTFKPITNTPNGLMPRIKDKLQLLIAEQQESHDGNRSFSKISVKLGAVRRAVNIYFVFLKPNLKYEMYLLVTIGVCRTMTLRMLRSVWMCSCGASTITTKLQSVCRAGLLSFKADLVNSSA